MAPAECARTSIRSSPRWARRTSRSLTRRSTRKVAGSAGSAEPPTPRGSTRMSRRALASPAANGIHLGPLFIHVYGLMYVIGIAVALYIATRRWAAAGGGRSLVYDV